MSRESAISRRTVGRRQLHAPGRRLSRLGERRRQLELSGASGPLSSLRFARVSVGAPHDHRAQAQRPRARDRHDGRRSDSRRARLAFRRERTRSDQRLGVSERSVFRDRSRVTRARDRSGAVGHAAAGASSATPTTISCACSKREFDAFARRRSSISIPPSCAPQIDELNELLYETVNDGVYRAGFATSQAAYEARRLPALRRRSTRWKSGSAIGAISSAPSRSRPIGASS